mmetsp:Transcript_131829/g.263082  ORF Transcript_131829/g.263082 Transcript_131829/m.263082 type:complete len:157 (-) Transcript_131829:53-523(-)
MLRVAEATEAAVAAAAAVAASATEGDSCGCSKTRCKESSTPSPTDNSVDCVKVLWTATVDEEDAQAEYEETTAASADKCRVDSESVADRERAKADLEPQALNFKEKETAAIKGVSEKAEILEPCIWTAIGPSAISRQHRCNASITEAVLRLTRPNA